MPHRRSLQKLRFDLRLTHTACRSYDSTYASHTQPAEATIRPMPHTHSLQKLGFDLCLTDIACRSQDSTYASHTQPAEARIRPMPHTHSLQKLGFDLCLTDTTLTHRPFVYTPSKQGLVNAYRNNPANTLRLHTARRANNEETFLNLGSHRTKGGKQNSGSRQIKPDI